jgi:hypothetical protein
MANKFLPLKGEFIREGDHRMGGGGGGDMKEGIIREKCKGRFLVFVHDNHIYTSVGHSD